MPVVDRRRVRRESCRADHAAADVRALAAALSEVAVAISGLADVIETGLENISVAVREAGASREGSLL